MKLKLKEVEEVKKNSEKALQKAKTDDSYNQGVLDCLKDQQKRWT